MSLWSGIKDTKRPPKDYDLDEHTFSCKEHLIIWCQTHVQSALPKD